VGGDHFIKTTIIINNIITAIGVHIGASTHTQLHAITLQSFSTINTMVRSPKNPIPELDDYFSMLFYFK